MTHTTPFPQQAIPKKPIWCAIYTRQSVEENPAGSFTSLDAQKEYCRNFVMSRGGEGWQSCPDKYDDPGFSGKNMDRPALQRLLSDAYQGKFQIVVAYKFDRLTRNTKDFLTMLDFFEKHGVAFV